MVWFGLGETEYVRFFPVEMEANTKTKPFSIFSSVFSTFRFWFLLFFGFRFGFSGRDGNQNRTVFDFRFGFTILVSCFFSVSIQFSRSRWKQKTEPFLIFGSIFSVLVSRFSSQNQNQTVFNSFYFGFSESRWKPKTDQFSIFGFGFSILVFFFPVSDRFLLTLPFTIPSNQTRPKCMVKFHSNSFKVKFLDEFQFHRIPFREPNAPFVF